MAALVATAAVAVAVAVPLAAPSASAAVDTTWQPAAGAVPTSATYVYLTSSPGDYALQGKTYTYTPVDTDLEIGDDGGTAWFGVRGDQEWDMAFTPSAGVTSLVKGAVSTDPGTKSPGVPNIVFTGEGRACSNTFGWYAIDDVTYSGSTLTSLLMRFELRCSRADNPPMRGQIRYSAAAPIPGAPTPTLPIPSLWAPAAGTAPATGSSLSLSSQAGDFLGQGTTYLATDPASFRMADTGAALIRLGIDDWYLEAAASNRSDALAAGFYPDLMRYPFHNPVKGGFTFMGDGRACNQSRSWVAIDEIDPRGGDLSDVTLRFEQHCDGATAALRGRLHWEPAPASGAPGVPTSVTAAPVKKGATVSWGAPTSAGTSAVSGYEVYAYEQGNVTGPPVTLPASARSTTFSDLPVGVPYTFKVRALNATGGSWRSAGVTAVPADPAPKVSSLTPASGIRTGGTAIRIGGVSLSGATGVKVGGTSVPFTQVSDSRIDIVSPNLPAGNHQVIVTTSDGTSPSGTGSTWTAARVKPSAPTNVGGTPRTGGLDATWSAPTAPGDDPITSYTVSATKAGSLSAQVTLTAGASATTIPITGLVPGASYTVKVVANSAAGSSPGATSGAIVVPPVETGPFVDVTALVKRQYLDFAGRAATSSEAAKDAAPIAAGTTAPEAYIAAMRNRPEWAPYRAPVIRLYSAYFDRLPDSGGLTYWAGKLRSGTRLSQVSASFAASNEFKRKYGKLSNRSFVLLIYTNVLKRTPDAGGVDYWTGKLDKGMSRGTVMTNFSESSENVRKTTGAVDIVLVYTGMLRRVPSSSELAAELAVLDADTPITDLVGRILESQAYAGRF